MELPTGKQNSYCSRWAGQNKGAGDVAVLSWVQMKKHTDNQKTQIEKLARKYLLVLQNMLFDFTEAGKDILNIFWKIWIYMQHRKTFLKEHIYIYLQLEIERI